ncbi:hypothetical protein D0812_11565 [Vibrio owensii]|uniref:Fimbrial protein n=1 Tax=Vibrio owensii TaxID=696485 RepID=A0AAP9GBW1_9VIBR|nr:hypothetical protein [Vibrio owensii]AYO15017.1 hypothetical protein D0812_11565 [Vibrio owensii]QGH47311.1 hypothetical protein APZ19_09520 [Vibrio owensii]
MIRSASWLLLLAAPLVHSATLNVHIEGQQLRLENAIALGGNTYTLSDWTVASGLTPTDRFLPGAYLTNKPDEMTLTGPTGANVNAPIGLKGVQYNVSSNNYVRNDTQLVTPSCATSQLSGNTVTLADDSTQSCSASFSLDYSNEVTPFYFYRPTFDLDTTALLVALQGQEKGVYTATIPADIRYYYQSSGGALTYRVLSDVFTVNIDYVPNSLESIDVAGDGVLEPIYDTANHTVSSETTFNITATGTFTTGLSMTLLSHDFKLTSNTGETKIPFSIQCSPSNCEDLVWVENGVNKLKNDETSYLVDTPTNIINFELNVSYNDIPFSDVESGTYSGSFTVMFEELY